MASAEAADPSFRRAMVVIALLSAAACLVFSGVFSQLAPLGVWPNLIFGAPKALEFDPGGPYVSAAHQLAWGEAQLWEGHPGTVLMLMLAGVQHAWYALAGSASGFTFTEFTARQLPHVFVLSKLMMTVLHLGASFVTFLLARRLLRDERAGAVAGLAYLTSLPVTHYWSRISVEPVMVIAFGLSLLAVWRYQDLARASRCGSALCFAALSGWLAVSGVVTKLAFLLPLVPFLAVVVTLGGWRDGEGPLVPWRTRGLALLVLLGSSGLALLFYSQLIDWELFFGMWDSFVDRERGARFTLADLLPGFSSERAFVLCEAVYVAVALAGGVAFVRREPTQRMRVLQVSVWAAWGIVLFGYRASLAGSLRPFHYFHLSNVVFASFFGFALMSALRRLPGGAEGWKAALVAVLAVAVVHAASLWAVVDTRIQDARFFEPQREILRVVAELEPEQRLACFVCKPKTFETRSGLGSLHSVGWKNPLTGEASILAAEFESLFVPIPERRVDPESRRIPVPTLNSEVVVFVPPAGRPTRPR